MSRSPSAKFLTRSNSQTSDSSSHHSPHQSPSCRRFGLTPQRRLPSSPHTQSAPSSVNFAQPQTQSPSSLTPLRPSGRLSLRSAKSAKTSTPSRPISRLRASPRSPLRRALQSNADSANSTLQSSIFSGIFSAGQENISPAPRSPPLRRNLERPSRHSLHLDVSGVSQHAFLKALDASKSPPMAATSTGTGALKRSDATMNLDQPHHGSPVAKRRSLHGFSAPAQTDDINAGAPKSIGVQSFEILDDSNTEYELTGTADGPVFEFAAPPASASSLPQRSSSLRKTTLQQRYGEKGSWGRKTGERHLAQMRPDGSASPARNRPRLSTDQFLPPQPQRDSIFSSKIPLPSASIHSIETNRPPQPHPLSKTLTTSSSGQSLEEEQRSEIPTRAFEATKPHPFSRSLPANAIRPSAQSSRDHNRVMATPNASGQLWHGAFNSTGLISKVNRNFEEEAERKITAPDTPCKKHVNPFNTFPPPFSSALKKKSSTNRNSFGGTPSTPFSSGTALGPDSFGKPGKGLSIFQRGSALRKARRGSFLVLDEEDRRSSSEQADMSVMGESDIPPTPTKNTLTPSASGLSQQSLESPSANRTVPMTSTTPSAPPPLALSAVRPPVSRESTSKFSQAIRGARISSTKSHPMSFPVTCSGSVASSLPRPFTNTSSGRPRSRRELHMASNLSLFASAQANFRTSLTKTVAVLLESPVDGRRTPQTPQESYLPWDASRLSISYNADGLLDDNMPPPVTPTGARDLRSSTSIFVTPANGRNTNLDIDAGLNSRFDKVEYIGKGEFSSVFRVTATNHRQNALELLTGTPQSRFGRSPAKESVFAVKKSRRPFQGPKDREAKLREVNTLQALTHANHVVRYIDSWELNMHLYIQTEFCEEGTLDKFLATVGRGGRLDDFRIFKVLQDLCLVSRADVLNYHRVKLMIAVGPQRDS